MKYSFKGPAAAGALSFVHNYFELTAWSTEFQQTVIHYLYIKIKSVVTILLTFVLTSITINAQVKSLIVKDVKRRYIVYVPKSYEAEKDKKFPVVFNFHGGEMTMAEQMLYTQMNKTADKYESRPMFLHDL